MNELETEIKELITKYKKMNKNDLIDELVILKITLNSIKSYCSVPLEDGYFPSPQQEWCKDYDKDILYIIERDSDNVRELLKN